MRTARPQVNSDEILRDSGDDDYAGALDFTASFTKTFHVEDVEPVKFLTMEQAEYERFMEDVLVIQIQGTTDENAPPRVYVGVNGDDHWFYRDTPIKVRRKFIEPLAQSLERKFAALKETDDPSLDNRYPISTRQGQSYQFQVLQDKHPLGQRWLAKVYKDNRRSVIYGLDNR